MNSVSKIQKMLDLFFAFNHVEGRESLHIEGSDYSDKFFRWTKKTFKNGSKFTVIYNADRVVMFDTLKVKDRISGNLDKVKSSPNKNLFGIHPNVVSDLMMIINIEEFTDKDKLEMARDIEIQQFNKNKRIAEHNKTHCTCEIPNYRSKVSENGNLTYCITCNKMK